MKRLTLALAMLISAPALGAHENRNGGDVIYCNTRSDQGIFDYQQTLFLLDYLENSTLRGLNFSVTPPDVSVSRGLSLGELRQSILEEFLGRVARHDQVLAESLAARLQNFFSEAMIVDLVLDPVDDSLHIGLPAGCRIEQAALQAAPVFPEDKRYLVAKRAWPTDYVRPDCHADFCLYPPDAYVQALRFDLATFQAGLMIHEVLLRRGIERGHTDSVRVRYFNAYIMSQRFADLDEAGWLELRRMTDL